MKLSAILLAGGYGSFKGFAGAQIAKVAARLNGRPMIYHIMESLVATKLFSRYFVVVNTKYGHQIKRILNDFPRVEYPEQPHRLGSAGAVSLAVDMMGPEETDAMVVYGDMPLWQKQTFRELVKIHRAERPVLTMVTIPLKTGTPVERFGRVIYGPDGRFLGTIDDPFCFKPEQFVKAEKVNPSLYLANVDWLRTTLPHLPAHDKQDGFPPEKLMQTCISVAYQKNHKVSEFHLTDYTQALGVNTKQELREVRKIYSKIS